MLATPHAHLIKQANDEQATIITSEFNQRKTCCLPATITIGDSHTVDCVIKSIGKKGMTIWIPLNNWISDEFKLNCNHFGGYITVRVNSRSLHMIEVYITTKYSCNHHT